VSEVEAFILLKAKGDHRDLMKKFSQFDETSRVYNITGDNDILLKINMKKLDDMKDFINKIRSMENILETTSYIVLSRYK
jgi:DNA-binding Lrp family transcriptional regulator